MMNEDYTAGVLKGIPIFCINRDYTRSDVPFVFTKEQYLFKFENGYSVSIVEFVDWEMSSGYQYEMLIDVPGDGGNPMHRGNAKDMLALLIDVEHRT